MRYTVEKKDGKAHISFIVSAREWETDIEAAYQKNKHHYSQQGFRKGHVPRKVLEGIYGKELFYEDAFNGSFAKYYEEFLDKEPEIYPVEQPQVTVEEFKATGIKFSVVVSLKPEFVLGAYTGLKIKKITAEVSDKDVDAQIEAARERSARMVDVERPVQNGDIVTIDYSGSVKGVKFDGGTAQKQTLTIGDNKFIPGFEEQLVGMKKGETKNINVTFPAEYHAKQLKGAKAVFEIVMHEIKEKTLPAADDEFAKDVSEFNTLEEYKAEIRKNLLAAAEKETLDKQDNEILAEICKGVNITVPECMIEEQSEQYLKDFEYQLMYQGLKLDDYMKYAKTTKEKMLKDYTERSERAVKTRLVMQKIVEKEKFEVAEADLDAKIAQYAEEMGKSKEEYRAMLKEQQLDYLRNQIVTDKLLQFLRTNNTIAD